jgi:hypothetical protein
MYYITRYQKYYYKNNIEKIKNYSHVPDALDKSLLAGLYNDNYNK